jgi:hypothetical protein
MKNATAEAVAKQARVVVRDYYMHDRQSRTTNNATTATTE